MVVCIMVQWVLVQKNPLEEPCNCRMRAKGLIMHDKEDLAVFIPQNPIPFLNSSTRKSNVWDKMGDRQSIYRLPQNVIHFVM